MLLDRKGRKEDIWAQDGRPSHSLLRWEDVSEGKPLTGENIVLGLDIPNTVRIEALAPWLSHVALVSIRFPSFSDGRGMSLARHIRRQGYQGLLRAQGPLIPDEFYYLTQCGFDEVLLPDSSAQRQTIAHWQQALAVRNGGYQQGYVEASSILHARRNARAI